MRAASLQPIKIADADAHDNNDISGSHVAVAVDGYRPQFESPVTRTCDRSCSVEEEARAFDLGW